MSRETLMRLAIRSVFFTITLPGFVVILIPYLILRISGPITFQDFSPKQIFSVILWLISVFVLLYCIWSFAKYGEGTLAPVDPPKRLVITAPYRYTRNPMYLAVFSALLSEAIFFNSSGILIFSLIALTLFHLFVLFYEEPKLKAEFGASYEEYIKSVPRWGFRTTPYKLDRST